MLAWIWNILVGRFCIHHWVIMEQRDITEGNVVIGAAVYLQCDKCGDVTRRHLT